MGKKRTMKLHMLCRVVDADERIIEGYASTASKARDDLEIDPNAWAKGIEDFMRAPALLFDHGEDPEIGSKPVGKILEHRIDEGGLWVRAQIAKGLDYVEEKIWPAIEQGLLTHFSINAPWSSIKRVGNKIVEIALREISLVSVPADVGATFNLARAMRVGSDLAPAEAEGWVDQLESVASELLSARARAAVKLAIDRLQSILWEADWQDRVAARDEAIKLVEQTLLEVTEMERDEVTKLVNEGVERSVKGLREEVKTEIAGVGDVVRSALAEDAEARTKATEDAEAEAQRKEEADEEFERRITETVEARLKDGEFVRKTVWGTTDAGGSGPTASIAVGSKYDELDAGEMAYLRSILAAKGVKPADDELFLRATLEKAVHGIKAGSLDRRALPGQMLVRADELMGSDVTGYGDEWVPTVMSADLWQKVRLENVVMRLMPQVEMPTPTYEIPYEGADPTVYYVEQTDDEAEMVLGGQQTTASKAGTGKTSVSAKKLSALTLFTEEFREDSIIPVVNQLRVQTVAALSNAADGVLLNGDVTTAKENINARHSATPSIAAKTNTLAFDGLRHYCLIDHTGQARDGSTLAVEDFTANRKLMAKHGKNKEKVVHFIDLDTYYDLLDQEKIQTVEKVGGLATLITGDVEVIGGVPVFASAELALTNASGYVDAETTTNNIKGNIVTVYRPGFVVGWRRRITMEIERVPLADSWILVSSIRIGMVPWAGSDATVAALSYNLS